MKITLKLSTKNIKLSDKYKTYLTNNYFKIIEIEDGKSCFDVKSCNEYFKDSIESGVLCINDKIGLCPDFSSL